MSQQNPVIIWFRQDLRLSDNPALAAAVDSGAPLLAVYVLDDDNAGEWAPGAASRWWLHRSLEALDRSIGGRLHVLRGKADEVLPALAERVGATAVFWNRCYEPWRIERDRRIKEALHSAGLSVRSFNGSLLREPHEVTKPDGTPYRVFTPYYRSAVSDRLPAPREPLDAPRDRIFVPIDGALSIDSLNLLPQVAWHLPLEAAWTPGEAGARQRLQSFLAHGVTRYAEGRDRPDREFVSRLSPHLHFGEISPQQVRAATLEARTPDNAQGVEAFLRQLGWRDFSCYLLYHWPQSARENLQRRFDRFPWRDDPGALRRWQRGETGYPIVDAGMRELWQTGYMHNRVRMIAASFLVKNLMIHWHSGEDWFWDTLVDADLANNSAGWQWVAGSGADAAPYFRIFNPVTQGRKFDPDGEYVRRYVPEITRLPDRFIHSPWEAPADTLRGAGVTLGSDYPLPVVELKASRERALAAFRSISGA